MAYKSIKDPGKVSRMGGTAQRILLAPFLDFLILQKPAAGKYNITEAHTFPVGKGFIELYVTKDTGTVKYSPLGGPDRNSFDVTGEFYHPGESDEIEAFANDAKNERWIALVPVPGIPELFQVGDADFQVQIMPEYDATKNSGDGRGWNFKYSCFAANKIKYKASTITMAADPA
ncbi:hypothetical protein [Spirosoma oryzicola]|uniref:hypothetical protein n=1 Tax=Spirosoma oryzicola TaxID=2898794 RepID=UPI001E44EBCE|nr:hypothetical protein [Spirosoma oryzicola]UHG93446.1 hypothetical protein LQ777_11190 [Spirosoma oryzicola]